MDSQFCWPFPNRRQTEAENERNFTIFSLLQGVASLRPIHSYKTACSTSRICSMCFAREGNAITRKWQNQTHWPSIRRNIQAPPPRRVTVLQRSDKNRLKKPYRNASKSTRPPKRSATTKVTKAVGKNTRPNQLSRQTCAKHGKPKGTFKPKDKKDIPFCSNWILATAHVLGGERWWQQQQRQQQRQQQQQQQQQRQPSQLCFAKAEPYLRNSKKHHNNHQNLIRLPFIS